MTEQLTQVKYVEAPMNLGMQDRVALLNIILRDMQVGGARIFDTRMVDNGWEIEYMGAPEPTPVEVVEDGTHE